MQACMLYDGEDVMIALGITALLVIFLTAFAFQVNLGVKCAWMKAKWKLTLLGRS